jgi:hypothetical protein
MFRVQSDMHYLRGHSGDRELVLGNLTREPGRFPLRDLFPCPFNARLWG